MPLQDFADLSGTNVFSSWERIKLCYLLCFYCSVTLTTEIKILLCLLPRKAEGRTDSVFSMKVGEQYSRKLNKRIRNLGDWRKTCLNQVRQSKKGKVATLFSIVLNVDENPNYIHLQ